MIKALIFDFGQTLVDSADGFRAAEQEAKDAIFLQLASASKGPSWEKFLATYRKIRKEFHGKSCFSRPAIWQEVYRQFNCDPTPNLIEKWENRYWEQVKALTHPFKETVQVLEKLSRRYRLALVTNTQGQKNAGKHRIALFPQLEKFFKLIIVAGESGIPPKPDPEPFRLCMAGLDVLPHETVMVGDDWRIDIGGAENTGIQPVWLRHDAVRRNWPEVETTVPIITRLDQLFDLPFLNDQTCS